VLFASSPVVEVDIDARSRSKSWILLPPPPPFLFQERTAFLLLLHLMNGVANAAVVVRPFER
jgi:hypothetical protein